MEIRTCCLVMMEDYCPLVEFVLRNPYQGRFNLEMRLCVFPPLKAGVFSLVSQLA